MLITFLEILPPNFQLWRLPKGQDESRDMWRTQLYLTSYISPGLRGWWREKFSDIFLPYIEYMSTVPTHFYFILSTVPTIPFLFYFILSTWYSCSLLSFYFIYIWRLLTFASYNVWHYTNFPKMPSWKTVL